MHVTNVCRKTGKNIIPEGEARISDNVNSGLINHGLLIVGGTLQIVTLYDTFYGIPPIKQP